MAILSKLKEATTETHRRLEEAVDISRSARDADAYRSLLIKFYGFYSIVEPRLQRTLAESGVEFDFEERRKLPLLERDLRGLSGGSFDFGAVELCSDPPAVDSFCRALGCLYVIEGATLGGQIISRILKEHLDLSSADGAAFFGSYGDRVGAMWKAFGAMATEQAERAGNDDEIVAAACETFEKLEKWLTRSATHGSRAHGTTDFKTQTR